MGEVRIIDAMFVMRHGDNVSVLACSDLSFRARLLVGELKITDHIPGDPQYEDVGPAASEVVSPCRRDQLDEGERHHVSRVLRR